jgi:hypothetical protein
VTGHRPRVKSEVNVRFPRGAVLPPAGPLLKPTSPYFIPDCSNGSHFPARDFFGFILSGDPALQLGSHRCQLSVAVAARDQAACGRDPTCRTAAVRSDASAASLAARC